MWASIGTILTALLPVLVKLIWYIWGKKEDSDKMERDMVILIDRMSKDIPVQIRDKYSEQVEKLKQRVLEESKKNV